MNAALPAAAWIEIDDALLRAWPLPLPSPEADKNARGRVLVVAGSEETPGAALLAGIAALRAGAGRLALLSSAANRTALACALPEARVVAALGDAIGEADAANLAGDHDTLLIGPGLRESPALDAFVHRALAQDPALHAVLDAGAIAALKMLDAEASRRVLVTPHAGELARLRACTREAVTLDLADCARRTADRWGCCVVLKDAHTHVVAPGRGAWRHGAANAGLATSGSGDVLAGTIAGLLARGAAPEQAAVWGVALHARAGAALARRCAPLGYLARELAGEIPHLLSETARR